MRDLPLLAHVVVALLASGCSTEAPESRPPSVSVHDGISVIDIGALSAAPTIHVLNEPDLVLSGDPSPFFRVMGAISLPGGRIAVLNAGYHKVQVYDATGRLDDDVGAPGDGPGEFRMPTSILPLGADSFAVFDHTHQRLTLFVADSALRVVRTIPLGSHFVGQSIWAIGAPSSVDWLLEVAPYIGLDAAPGFQRPMVQLTHYGTDGDRVRVVRELPGTEVYIRSGDRFVVRTPPFARRSFIVSSGARLAIADSHESQASVLDLGGTVRTIVRFDTRQDPVAAAHVASETSSWQSRAEVSDLSDRRRSDSVPQLGGLLLGADSTVWLRSPFPKGGRYRWTMVDPATESVGSIEADTSLTVVEASRGHVLALRVNPFGERIEYHRLSRR